MIRIEIIILIVLISFGCNNQVIETNVRGNQAIESLAVVNKTEFDTASNTIHVLVALCDNKYQGIVPVPAKIGNGQDLNNNLYWGCAYGVRSFFKKSNSWTFLKSYFIDSIKMERAIFKNKNGNFYLVADAYNGKYIKICTEDFLRSCSGQMKDTLHINGTSIGINGNSRLIAYVGHDGLMDFNLKESFINPDRKVRDAIILACISKRYFSSYLTPTKANPLVWSTGLMSPEAYTLHDALESYIKGEPAEKIRTNAARAYSRYQKCSENASRKLLVSGF